MKIGFIGMGNMAGAIVGGILKKDIVKPQDIIASRRNKESLEKIRKEWGILITTDNKEVASKSDILFLAVKPQFLEEVIFEIKEFVKENTKQIVITMSPGKSMEWTEKCFGKKVKVVRCMPNTPALVGEGCTAFCVNQEILDNEKEIIQTLLSSFGMASEINENMMDAVVGVSGSSPAYVFIFIEAMADGAVAAGMPRKQAYEFAAQAVLGSAKMVLETKKHPGELKDMVCSPGGTTIQAVKVLEDKGLRSCVMEAMEACIKNVKT